MKTSSSGAARPITPYVGFGLGAAFVQEDRKIFAGGLGTFIDVDEKRTEFAYQVRAGVTCEVNRRLDLSLGYRFVHINGDKHARDTGFQVKHDSLKNHSVELGAAFEFQGHAGAAPARPQRLARTGSATRSRRCARSLSRAERW